MVHPQAKSIRSKKLGVLIRDARQASGKSLKVSAASIGVSSATFGAYERGVKSPSLPELEVLTYYLNVPLGHFWGHEAISEKPPPTSALDVPALIEARQIDIGGLLKAARLEAGLSLKELAPQVEISPSRLSAFESGKRPIPLPELELLINALDRSLQDFTDRDGPVGGWLAEKETSQRFLELPPDLQEFVCKPINRPFLELAQRLSELPTEKLRAVAEGLLEITL